MADNPTDMNLQGALQGSDPSFTAKLQDVVGGTINHIGESVKQKAQQDAAKKTTFTWDSSTNTVTGTMDADYMKQMASDLQAYQGVRAEYDKMLAQNAQQMAAQKAHPFANTLAQIAAGLAANDTNPVTRGIGQAATRLNPTMAEMQKERMGLLQGQEGAIQGQMAGAGHVASMAQAQAMHEQTRQDKQIANFQTTMRDGGIDARQGEFDKEGFIKAGLSTGAPRERVLAEAERLDGVNNDKKMLRAAAEKSAEAKKLAAEADAANKTAATNAEWWKRHGAEEREKDAREMAREAQKQKDLERKDKEAKGKLGPVLEQKVETILSAKRSGNKLLEIFDPNTTNPEYKHFQDITGPLRGREVDMEKWVGSLNAKDAEFVAKIQLQFVNAVKTLGAGAYGYRISERGFIQSFAEALKNGAPQNYGNLSAWMTKFNDDIESMKTIKDQYDWSKVDAVMQTPPGQPFPDQKQKDEVWTPEKVKALRGGK